MKKLLLLFLTLLFLHLAGIAQNDDLSFELRKKYSRPVKKETLMQARSLQDMIVSYPSNWISSYVSVELLATCKGRPMKATSANETLSAEQKNMLSMADPGSEMIINVKYTYRDPVTHVIENNTMHVAFTIVPEKEAGYPGGTAQLKQHLKAMGLKKDAEPLFPAAHTGPNLPPQYSGVQFTINEKGEVENAWLFHTSPDQKRDQLLLEAVRKMPKWTPAENSKGVKMKQEFELVVGNRMGDGC